MTTDGPAEQGGIQAGEAAAQAMLDARAGDGYLAAFKGPACNRFVIIAPGGARFEFSPAAAS